MTKDIYDILAETPCVQRATRWWLIYRDYLYKGTFHERRIRAKLDAAQDATHDQVEALMEKHGYKGLWLEDTRVAGLRRAPGWSSDGWPSRVRATQCERRMEYWKDKSPERARYWEIRRVALEFLRAPWPIPPGWIRQAERWLAALPQEQRRIEAAARQERERIEFRNMGRALRRGPRAGTEGPRP